MEVLKKNQKMCNQLLVIIFAASSLTVCSDCFCKTLSGDLRRSPETPPPVWTPVHRDVEVALGWAADQTARRRDMKDTVLICYRVMYKHNRCDEV